MKSFTFTTNNTSLANDILHNNDIKFVRMQDKNDVTTYILDLENGSPKISDLRDNFELPI